MFIYAATGSTEQGLRTILRDCATCSLVVADVNGDGHLDNVEGNDVHGNMNAAEPRGPSRLLLNDGQLGFTEVLSPFPYTHTGANEGTGKLTGDEKTIFSMAAADFDGDGGAHRWVGTH